MKTLIAAALLLAFITSSHAATEGEWFLSLDMWTCSTKGCSGGSPNDEFVVRDTFTTREQCRAEGRRLENSWKNIVRDVFSFRPVRKDSVLQEMVNLNAANAGTVISRLRPRCEWHG